MKPTVIVDVDDTLADTQHALVEYLHGRGDPAYNYEGVTRAMREGADSHYNERAHQFLSDHERVLAISPLPGTLTAVKRLTARGYDVHIASSRGGERLHQLTRLWLTHHGFSQFVTQVHDRPDDTERNAFKVEVARVIRAVGAFDDAYDAAAAIAATHASTYLLNRPWNQQEVLVLGMTRADSLGQAVDLFLARHI